MTAYALLVGPFAEYAFMRRALVACLALALGSAPIGTFLVLRRMSLAGDAMAHALLPGAALGFIGFGFVLPAMSFGAFLAGLAVALAAGAVTRATAEREDASFAAFYLIALAIGVLLVSTHGSSVDLMHLLFGSILAVDAPALLLVAAVSSVTLGALALLYRPLVVECVDPRFLRSVGGLGAAVHVAFLVLTVLNLVAGFQALGTLMAVGVMMLPATAARFWVANVWALATVAAGIALVSGYAGLLLSYHGQWPSGPSIVLVAGGVYLGSAVFGRRDGLLTRHVFVRRQRAP